LFVQDVSYDVPRGRGSASPQRILHAASLRILPSEFVCIIGANGSGKSTLLNILAGRALPSEGTVLLNDVDLHANFEALKQDIAFVPQQDVLHEQLTLRQALGYVARLRLPPDTSAAQRRAAVDEAARSVDLFDRLDQRVGSLSGGQKKCASLASEILNRPSVLLLDEVTSGLDESTDWEIMRLLRRLADEGMTIIVVTHTLANVTKFCDKVICMRGYGLLTFIGAPVDVLDFFGAHRLGEVFNRVDDLLTIAVSVVVVAGLYFGCSVLIPIMLAMLLSFLLAPLVNLPRRMHLGWLAGCRVTSSPSLP
jgi:ABC transport system ATP-binding/permease protein